ncbi:hypothetical protein BKA70DRAFT_1261713, partial [Coprinopsis sp. MPI-PUGE-AT-0042]
AAPEQLTWSRASVLIAVFRILIGSAPDSRATSPPDALAIVHTSVAKDEESFSDDLMVVIIRITSTSPEGAEDSHGDDAGVVSISSPAFSSGFIMLPSVVVEASTGLSNSVVMFFTVVAKGGLWEDLLFFCCAF